MTDHRYFPISYAEAEKARKVVYEFIVANQLMRYANLSLLLGADVYVKHENHNPFATLRVRGGINLMYHLKRPGINEVITFSTGNHGLSIAQTAAWYSIKSTVVVPENNNPHEESQYPGYSGTINRSRKTFDEASAVVEELVSEQSLYYAHPADEPHFINGVGTEFLEITESLPDLDAVIVPVGAGSETALIN